MSTEVPVSDVVPDYSRQEHFNTLEQASRIELDTVPHKEVGCCFFIATNGKHLCYNVVVWILLLVIVGLASVTGSALLVALPFVLFCTFCLPYLAISLEVPDFYSKTWQSEEDAAKILVDSVSKPPTIVQKMKCFHVSRVQGGADVQVVSHRETREKQYADWFDCSPEQTMTLNHTAISISTTEDENVEVVSREVEARRRHNKICRVHIKLDYDCYDDETKSDFEAQRLQLIDNNIHRDANYEYNESFFLENIPSNILVNSKRNVKQSWIFSFRTYVLCTLIGCAFPFRLFLECCCVKSQVWESKKIVSSNEVEAEVHGRGIETALEVSEQDINLAEEV